MILKITPYKFLTFAKQIIARLKLVKMNKTQFKLGWTFWNLEKILTHVVSVKKITLNDGNGTT